MLEAMVLGLLLRYPDQICRVELNADDFADDWNSLVYRAMRAIVAQGHACDCFSVAQRLGSEQEHLADVVMLERENSGALENLAFYVGELRKESRGRKFVALLEQAKAAAETHDGDKVRAKLITRLTELDHGQTSHVSTSRQIMHRVVDHLATLQEARDNGRAVGVPTGLGKIDRCFGGLHRGDLVIAAGRPGAGKTAFAVGVAIHAAQAGCRVGIVSTEMDALQIGLRLITAQTAIGSYRLRTGDLEDYDYPRLTAATTVLAQLPLVVNDRSVMTVGECALQARAWSLSGGLDLLVVDYLQRLRPDGGDESRTMEVGRMAMAMKDIARSLNIPVLCLAQLNRGVTQRVDKRPTSADLRDSGMIEQEADQVFLLHRPSMFDDAADKLEASVIVDKNRHGECLEISCRYEPSTMRWVADEEPSQEAKWAMN